MDCVITQTLIKLLFWIPNFLFQRGNLDWILNVQHCVIMRPSTKHKQLAQHSCLTSPSFSWIVTIKEGVLSFLHSSAVVSVMGLLGSGALLQATVRHCLIYTHYFLLLSSGMWKEEEKNPSLARNSQLECISAKMEEARILPNFIQYWNKHFNSIDKRFN